MTGFLLLAMDVTQVAKLSKGTSASTPPYLLSVPLLVETGCFTPVSNVMTATRVMMTGALAV